MTPDGSNVIYSYRYVTPLEGVSVVAYTSTNLTDWDDVGALDGTDEEPVVTTDTSVLGFTGVSLALPVVREIRFFRLELKDAAP